MGVEGVWSIQPTSTTRITCSRTGFSFSGLPSLPPSETIFAPATVDRLRSVENLNPFWTLVAHADPVDRDSNRESERNSTVEVFSLSSKLGFLNLIWSIRTGG